MRLLSVIPPVGTFSVGTFASPVAGLLAIILAGTIGAPGPATAQSIPEADLSPGSFVVYAREWDYETNRWLERPPEGSETACFEVGETTAEGVHIWLVSGQHYLTWSGETVTEFDTTWFTSDAYRDTHPGADLTEHLRREFVNVAGCPAR